MLTDEEHALKEQFAVGDEVYFRLGPIFDNLSHLEDLVREWISKFTIGPHKIIRIDQVKPPKNTGLKFEGRISAGLGEDAPTPSMRKEMVWDAIYFTKTMPSN